MQVVSDEEWREIQNALLDHHSLFYKMGEIGKPFLTDITPTACVTFSKEGNFINFLFNPDIWNKSSLYEKIFVVCHECLHVILNHGKRFKDSEMPEVANMAMDIVVNHSLVDRFGFIREKISGWEDYCWVDTVFKSNKKKIWSVPTDETAEYYYNLLSSQMPQSAMDKLKTVDQHSFTEEDLQNLFDYINKNLSDFEKEKLSKFAEKHGKDHKTGTSHGGLMHFIAKNKIKVKKKWETVVKQWSQKTLQNTSVDEEQWAKKHRRFLFVERSLFLPSENEIEDLNFSENKLLVFFFLDSSGSCWHLKDRFFAAAESLPKNRFDIRLFCFDTKVVPTDLVSRKMVGGGGTSFSIIEQHIQQVIKTEKTPYPHAVWLISDGEGDQVNPEKPERWFWFLTEHGNTTFISNKSHTFMLSDFV